MKDQFSPLSQRLIAVGLLILLLLVLASLIILPAFGFMQKGLSSLRDVRLQVARAEAIRDRPDPAATQEVSEKFYIVAADRKAANEMVVGQIATLASRHGLQAQIDPAAVGEGAAPSLLSVSFRASGEQGSILAFINELERGDPLVRFRSLQLTQGDAGPLPGGGSPPPMPATGPGAPPSPMTAPEASTTSAPAETSSPEAEIAAPTPGLLNLQASVITLWGARK